MGNCYIDMITSCDKEWINHLIEGGEYDLSAVNQYLSCESLITILRSMKSCSQKSCPAKRKKKKGK